MKKLIFLLIVVMTTATMGYCSDLLFEATWYDGPGLFIEQEDPNDPAICTHSELVAKDKTDYWAFTVVAENYTTLFQRVYICKYCKSEIVIAIATRASKEPEPEVDNQSAIEIGQIWRNKGNDYEYKVLEVSKDYIVYALDGSFLGWLYVETKEDFLRHHSLVIDTADNDVVILHD